MTDLFQSEEWARFQEAAGHRVVRSEGAIGLVHALPLAGEYLYAPRWPDKQSPVPSSQFSNLITSAKELGLGWVRIEPETENLLRDARGMIKQKIVKAPHDMQPREIFVIETALDDAALLSAMKPKTRYNIRLAEKKGVQVTESKDPRFRQAFIDLVFETATRQKIEPHPRGYYELMLKSLGDAGHIFLAEHEGDVLAAAYVVYHGDTAYYLHGGSADAKKNLMAPHLLHFRALQAARAVGMKHYDFGGVKTDDVGGDWEGITRFKLGFSATAVPIRYPGCYDIVIDAKRYKIYQLGSAFRASLAHLRKKLK
jgi:lipid II:glycine glycyltransferase (peptidoglycan interpeptide bridge formation enzyme)